MTHLVLSDAWEPRDPLMPITQRETEARNQSVTCPGDTTGGRGDIGSRDGSAAESVVLSPHYSWPAQAFGLRVRTESKTTPWVAFRGLNLIVRGPMVRIGIDGGKCKGEGLVLLLRRLDMSMRKCSHPHGGWLP